MLHATGERSRPAKRPRCSTPRRTAHTVHFLSANDNEASDEEEEESRPKLPPFSCMQDDQLHIPILICAKGEDHGDMLPALVFYGRTCTEQFYDWLLTETEVSDEPQEVIVIFHNLKGYDGMFILQYLYHHRIKVKAGRLTFKDSLCFLPLASPRLPPPSI